MRKHQRLYIRGRDKEVYAYYHMDKKTLYLNTSFSGDKIRKIIYVKANQ